MKIQIISSQKMTALIALCPMLAASHSLATGLSLGLISLLVVISITTVIYLCRGGLTELTKVTIAVLTTTTFAICATFIMQAFAYELWQALGVSIFLAASCGFILVAQQKNYSMADRIKVGLFFLVALIGTGATREILGAGTLLSDMHLIFGGRARLWQINIFSNELGGFLLLQSAPGIFLMLGLLIAIKNWLTKESESDSPKTDFIKGAKRVRTTGRIS